MELTLEQKHTSSSDYTGLRFLHTREGRPGNGAVWRVRQKLCGCLEDLLKILKLIFLTQSCHPISCYEKSVEWANEIGV